MPATLKTAGEVRNLRLVPCGNGGWTVHNELEHTLAAFTGPDDMIAWLATELPFEELEGGENG